MANVYTTQTKVLDELFTDVSADVQAKIPGWAEDESRNIDAALVNYTTPFNDIAGTPATPPIIEKACRYYVAHRVLQKLGVNRYDENEKASESYEQKADRLIRRLRDGEDVIPQSQL